MAATGDRLLDKSAPPAEETVREWLGRSAYRYWQELRSWIEANYPGTFAPDWVFGGAKHGWALRYKKSRAFCSLIPEYRRLSVVIVFGAKERQQAEAMLPQLPAGLGRLYAAAATFADGKWLKLSVPDDAGVTDVAKLLTTKRRPRPRNKESQSP